ncbi:hypothetical protein [Kutzneria sp. CA-103260]|uniref:hypothetical protein n=1 Tax=Kutzneria sp. CA-103260 TaxID=2802641 RepID=UPI001BADE25E|nr:hypothetical protein [Kutzneria sp. CA-103260]QUQ67631.1 hypothetical protein JJ691_53660 [Kutzneria sp. CA-103260]
MSRGKRVTVAAFAATVALAVAGCAAPAPAAAPSWEQRTVGVLLDLLHVTAPQPYLDDPDGAGDVAVMANAALIVRHAGQTPDTVSFKEFEQAGLYGDFDPLGQSVQVHRALGTVPGSAQARATVDRLGMLVRPGQGFADPSGKVGLAATVHALELLDLLTPAGDQDAKRLRDTARVPDVCSRLATAGHAGLDDLVDAGVVLRLAVLQHDTCPAGSLSALAQAVRALPAGDPLDPSHIELLRGTVAGLGDLGALTESDRRALAAPLADAFRVQFGRSDTALSASGLQIARNALDALDALGVKVDTPPSLVESARRMLRWHGSLADIDPNGQADRTVVALYTLRLLAQRAGGRDDFTTLLAGIRKAVDVSRLAPSDAMVWRTALGLAVPPGQATSASSTDGMLAAIGAFGQHLPQASAACGADPSGLIDTEAPALSQDQNLPAQAVRILRLAAASSLLLDCGGKNRQGEVRAVTARAVQQSSSTPAATVSGLAMLADAACLSGVDPSPLRAAATTAISRQRLADGAAAASGSVPDVQTTYDLVRLDTLSSGQCSAGWWSGLAGPG